MTSESWNLIQNFRIGNSNLK